MLTIFSTPKAFQGHTGIIQRNAIKSWTFLHPDCEVILIGNDEGTAEAALELGARHEADLLRDEHNTPYLNYIFDRAQETAKHDLLCYVNCDIVLMSDFIKAVEQTSSWRTSFLMVGRRWNTDIMEPLDFDQPAWEERLQAIALGRGEQCLPELIDYFVFPRGTYYKKMEPFLIGRPMWDNWLIWKTRSMGIPVVDVSSVVVAVHQNHDYSHRVEGQKGVRYGQETQHHYELAGGWYHLYSVDDATHVLTPGGVRRDFVHWFVTLKRKVILRWWFKALLTITRPIRHLMGLRQENMPRFTAKIKSLMSR